MISIIIPAYNEEGTIERIINDVDTLCKQNFKKYELLICDDFSTDKTFSLAKTISKKKQTIRVYSNNKNIGKFQTILKGLKLSKGDICAFMDSDYQYLPRDLIRVINKVQKGCDLCTGKRKERKDSFKRTLFSKFFQIYNRIFFGIKVDDVNCGLKAFKKSIFSDVKLKYTNTKWFMDTELIARSYNKNKKVCEIEVTHNYREKGSSKINLLTIISETIIYGFRLKSDLLFG